jgi:hypothetical protein
MVNQKATLEAPCISTISLSMIRGFSAFIEIVYSVAPWVIIKPAGLSLQEQESPWSIILENPLISGYPVRDRKISRISLSLCLIPVDLLCTILFSGKRF